jgi:Spy/CpxP family protein refolding chaperone
MTYRERRLRKAERLRGWAAKRTAKSAAAFESARVVADGIPMGQPILVGHHSERRHRRDIARIDSGMRNGVERA